MGRLNGSGTRGRVMPSDEQSDDTDDDDDIEPPMLFK